MPYSATVQSNLYLNTAFFVTDRVKPVYNGKTRNRKFSCAEMFRLLQVLQGWIHGNIKVFCWREVSFMPRFLKRQVLLMWVIIYEKNRICRNNRLHVSRRVCWHLCAHFTSVSCHLTDQRQQNSKYQQELLSRHLALEKDSKNPRTVCNTIYTHIHAHAPCRHPGENQYHYRKGCKNFPKI